MKPFQNDLKLQRFIEEYEELYDLVFNNKALFDLMLEQGATRDQAIQALIIQHNLKLISEVSRGSWKASDPS